MPTHLLKYGVCEATGKYLSRQITISSHVRWHFARGRLGDHRAQVLPWRRSGTKRYEYNALKHSLKHWKIPPAAQNP
eukprot:677502-Pyramimonas_sp.AAC.1